MRSISVLLMYQNRPIFTALIFPAFIHAYMVVTEVCRYSHTCCTVYISGRFTLFSPILSPSFIYRERLQLSSSRRCACFPILIIALFIYSVNSLFAFIIVILRLLYLISHNLSYTKLEYLSEIEQMAMLCGLLNISEIIIIISPNVPFTYTLLCYFKGKMVLSPKRYVSFLRLLFSARPAVQLRKFPKNSPAAFPLPLAYARELSSSGSCCSLQSIINQLFDFIFNYAAAFNAFN